MNGSLINADHGVSQLFFVGIGGFGGFGGSAVSNMKNMR
jgi:hypothetical protein